MEHIADKSAAGNRRGPISDDRYINTQEASDLLASMGVAIAVNTLNHWRIAGKGPPWSRLGDDGGRVFYLAGELRAWVHRTLEPSQPRERSAAPNKGAPQ